METMIEKHNTLKRSSSVSIRPYADISVST